MSPKREANKWFIVVASATALLVATPLTSKAATTWIPDLVFPQTGPALVSRPDRVVTGSIHRGDRTTPTVRSGHSAATDRADKKTKRGSHLKSKVRQR